MTFSDTIKLKVRQQAHFSCCLCHGLFVEVHHITPQAEGGLDSEDNAAPLCPSCHETYGANPAKRKFIREARDFWYDICQKRFASDPDRLYAIENKLGSLATKADLERLSIQNSEAYILGEVGAGIGSYWEHLRYSFVREEFIHPLILMELMGVISDPAETIVAVDLVQSNDSNRFSGRFEVRHEANRHWVEFRHPEGGFFVYSYIATSPSGVHMVECYDNAGGSGTFGGVILLSLHADRALYITDNDELATRDRVLLKTLGSIGLGDRYGGEIVYEEDLLKIGPDHGWFKRGDETTMNVPIR